MQHPLAIDQIKPRAKAIGLKLTRLARKHRLDPSSLHRALKPAADPRRSTLRKLDDIGAEIVAAERALLDHLTAIHGGAPEPLLTITVLDGERAA